MYDEQSINQTIKNNIPIFNIEILYQNEEIKVVENDKDPIYSLVSSYNSIDKIVESIYSTISKLKSEESLRILRASSIGSLISIDIDIDRNDDYVIQLSDQIGRIIQTEKQNLFQGVNNLKINRPQINGIHFIRVFNLRNNKNIVKPILIE